jgi:hypothetical protein
MTWCEIAALGVIAIGALIAIRVVCAVIKERRMVRRLK